MQVKKTITAVAASLVLSGAAFGTVAAASGNDGPKADTSTTGSVETSDTSSAEPAENSATDTDNVQEGVQSAPEQADAKESGTESEGVESDGPGGHEDPPGNVDHQFEGQE